jgi:hypothetical protein
MARRLALLVLTLFGAFAIVAPTYAAYPVPLALQGGDGLLSKDGSVRFVAVRAEGGASTVVTVKSRTDGSTLKTLTVAGSFGIPQLTYKGPAGGLFRDGSAFVLQSTGYAETTHFIVLGAQDLDLRQQIDLKGTYAFDALSPDASKMYLVQHTSADDLQHYVVRAYDLSEHKLLPGRIADRTQKNWVMQGWAISRAQSADGRWAYTLYANPGGYPFIHALDSVNGIAHCVGIPWRPTDGTQSSIYDFSLHLKGSTLVIRRASGVKYRTGNTTNWKVSAPKAR